MNTEAVEKLQISKLLLESSGVFSIMREAVNSSIRIKIISTLLRHEASSKDPVAYTELMKQLKDLPSNKLSYHLNLLQEAGLVKQLTKLSLKDVSEKTGYRSFYKTSALVMLLFRPCLEWSK